MSAAPYETIQEHLREEQDWLDEMLELAILQTAPSARPAELVHLGGLVLTQEEVRRALGTEPGRGLRPEGELAPGSRLRRRRIDERMEATRAAGLSLPILYLTEMLQLRPFEKSCLLLALAPEMDGKYERVFAFLQDDVTRRLPTVDLALALFCGPDEEERWEALESLQSGALWRRFEILDVVDAADGPLPLLSRRLKLDDRIVQFLLGSSLLEGEACRWAEVRKGLDTEVPPHLGGLLGRLGRLADRHFSDPDPPSLVIHLAGRYGSGRESLVDATAARLGLPVLWIDIEALLASGADDRALRRVFREALLQPAAVGVRRFHALLGPDASDGRRLDAVVEAIRTFSRVTFLVARDPWTPLDRFGDATFVGLSCPDPGYDARASLWAEALAGTRDPERHDVEELAAKFRFTPGQIRDALTEARARAGLSRSARGRIDDAALHAACRNQGSPSLGRLARKIDPAFTWDDIILPQGQVAQLREIAGHVRYARTVMETWGFADRFPRGRAVTALFAGGSGTGKTMAAGILAGDLQLDLFKIDLSGVVSKYIGETEKNLDRIFGEAQNSSAILFFDEADALFGKRSEVKDSHDRYANIEISYLLQRMEEYDGVVVLATNLKKNLDDAFVRRMRFIVDFPMPGERDRARIWRRIFPAQAPLADDVDVDFLARMLAITGGNIENIALRAAYTGAERGSGQIDMGCIVEAAKRELDKVGKLYTADELGAWHDATVATDGRAVDAFPEPAVGVVP